MNKLEESMSKTNHSESEEIADLKEQIRRLQSQNNNQAESIRVLSKMIERMKGEHT
jgi:hypothetical protein